MDQNLPVIAKRIWNMVRIAYLMLRKGISKSKLLADLNNLMSRRRKLAGKALRSLLTLHSTAGISIATDYEFSCSNTPNFQFFISRRRAFIDSTHAPYAPYASAYEGTVDMSPVLPGFGRSPAVRQLRVTDSPFPVTGGGDEDAYVDKAAEEFINRFYKELRLQTKAE